MLNKVIVYACRCHDGHYDKEGIPAIAHAIAVFNRTRDLGHIASATLAVALLHDVVEDCGVLVEDLRTEFGDTIADAVAAISRDKERESYFFYIARCKQNPIAQAVKLADLDVNIARCLASGNYPTLFERYRKAVALLTENEPRARTFID